MAPSARIALAQIDTTVGDFAGNAARIRAATERARAAGAGLVVFPELAISGYPPRDFLDLPDFLDLCACFQAMAHHTTDHLEAVNAFLEKRAPVFTGK